MCYSHRKRKKKEGTGRRTSPELEVRCSSQVMATIDHHIPATACQHQMVISRASRESMPKEKKSSSANGRSEQRGIYRQPLWLLSQPLGRILTRVIWSYRFPGERPVPFTKS